MISRQRLQPMGGVEVSGWPVMVSLPSAPVTEAGSPAPWVTDSSSRPGRLMAQCLGVPPVDAAGAV